MLVLYIPSVVKYPLSPYSFVITLHRLHSFYLLIQQVYAKLLLPILSCAKDTNPFLCSPEHLWEFPYKTFSV